MIYEFNDKKIKIPDADLERTMKGLDVSKEEAIEIWLEDEGYLDNDEQEALCKKAKENRVTATVHQAKSDKEKKKRVVERKENPLKEKIIALLAETLSKEEGLQDIQVVNIGKLIEFKSITGEEFKLDLIQKRKKK